MDSSSPQGPGENEEWIEEDDDAIDEAEEFESPSTGSKNKRKDIPGTSQGPAGKKKGKKTRSKVWKHYTRMIDDEDKCNCNHCGKEMACPTSSGTSSLRKHLRICKQYQVWNNKGGGKQQEMNHRGTLQPQKVPESVFREATNEMLVLGELPLAFVESLAWRHFCDTVKLYDPHSRRTATRDIVKLYVTRKEGMRNLCRKTKQRVSLTTDIWVAPTTGTSYMVITAHFIDSNWELKKLIIGFKNVDNYKGSSIAGVLLETLQEWGIERVFTITVDNATANTSALKRFIEKFRGLGNEALVLNGEFLHMRCAAHIINLVVRDGLQDVDKSVEAIRNGVTYVRSSTQRLKAFEQKVGTGKHVGRGSLSLDCRTRWNSTYLMLTRAIKFKSAFVKMEEEDKLYNEYFLEVDKEGKQRVGPPSNRDWAALERLVQFLVIFYHSTLVVSASSQLSSHKCYVEICTIEKKLIRLCSSRNEELRVKAVEMRMKFDKYWAGLREINRLVIIASVLDPKNKMQFAEMAFEKLYGKDSAVAKGMYDSVLDVLRRLFEEYSYARVSNVTSAGTSSQSAGAASQNSQSLDNTTVEEFDFEDDEALGYERMDCVYKEMVNERGLHDSINELDLYLKEPVENPTLLLGVEYDVLSWWRINSPKFPVLSEIAKDVLAMQLSSVASESAFSTSGRVLDPYRSCLTHYNLEVLMCTEQWLKCEIHMNEKGVITNSEMLADIELQDKLQREFENFRI